MFPSQNVPDVLELQEFLYVIFVAVLILCDFLLFLLLLIFVIFVIFPQNVREFFSNGHFMQ